MISRVRPAVVKIETGSGTGSGVIFDTQGQTGFVITNHHVIAEAGRVRVVVNDSTAYQGTVLGSDPVRDLAVVSICCGSFHSLSFGDISQLEPGDAVFALGYPLGIAGEATLTQGIVSAIRYDSIYQSDVIQTDAAINPGNSGGPMLSVSGSILGINTFKYSKIGVEGLGFAISGKTAQQRIPSLLAGAPRPTPTPTRVRPTPSAGVTSDFGPINGDLPHNPADGWIKTEYAGVSLPDIILEATFVNPYSASSHSWDYGFILRDNRDGSTGAFIQIAVDSERRWSLAWRKGGDSSNQRISGGTIANFNTGAAERNHLRVVAIEERGWFFVNGDFVATLDLSDVATSGDIAVITGAFTGDEVAGAVTRFEDFKISRLARRYGPADGTVQNEPSGVKLHNSRVWTRDLLVEATFTNPISGNWDYELVIRRTERNHLEIIGVISDARWFHRTRDIGDSRYTEVEVGRLPHSLQTKNHLLILAIEDSGWLFVNGNLVDKFDLSHNQDSGHVGASGGFIRGHQSSTSFENFNVWAP